MTELPWHVAIVNPNCHTRAVLELHSLGYRTFYPKIKRWVTLGRVRKAKEKPLLGRYLFVEISHQQSFGEVRRANGIESLVGVAGEPLKVDWQVVNDFRMRQMAGEFDETGEFQIGARIKIVQGQWDDYLATVIGCSKRGGRLSVKILGTAINTSIRSSEARAA